MYVDKRLAGIQAEQTLSRLNRSYLAALEPVVSRLLTQYKQALESEKVRSGLKDVLLGPALLYEALRARGEVRELPG